MAGTKQQGATKAQLNYRAQRFSSAAREIAAYNAEVYKQQRDARVAARLAKLVKAVTP